MEAKQRRGVVARRPSPQRRSSRDKPNRRRKEDLDDSLDNVVQQQAVLESLASYLEGELMVRLQSYTELSAEVKSLNKERLFYHQKLCRMEKVCERAQPYAANVPLVQAIKNLLADTSDRPDM